MSTEKALALVLRTTDWSETSRIATLWTRELGKVRALAKGGRRLRSSFENALDLLTLCSIVLLRKSSGGLDLLTEAQVIQRFPGLTLHLPALDGLRRLAEASEEWRKIGSIDAELRRVLGQYVTYRLGRRLRMLTYLEGLTGDPGKGSKRT